MSELDCGLQIADLKYIANPRFQSAIRNLQSAIYFVHHSKVVRTMSFCLLHCPVQQIA